MTYANSTEKKATIMIVDDTPANLAVLSDMLAEANYRVLVATDGLSALEQIEYFKPDIILLDVMMPGIDGFETCRRLKAQQETHTIPIIFMTGLSELDDLLRGFDEGAVDYIVKPIRPAEVLARVEAQLNQLRQRQKAEQTLDHVRFAALSVDENGIITWLTTTAVKILYDLFAACSDHPMNLQCGDYLPDILLTQFQASLISSNECKTDIKLGDNYRGKLIPCYQGSEYLVLIQKNEHAWNQTSLKTAFGLTSREAEILMWIARGKTNKEIGLILQSSPRTINKHLEHVFEKLGVPTRTAAIAKVLSRRQGLDEL